MSKIQNWLLNRIPPQKSFEIKNNRRTGILPSSFGWALLLMLAVMFVWSGNYRLNLGYAVIFIVLSVFLFSAVQAVWHLRGLKISAVGGEDVFAGEKALFVLELEHERARYALELQTATEKINVQLNAGKKKRFMVGQATSKRGKQTLAPLRIVSFYPFGFFQAWFYLNFSVEVWVYPRPAGDLPLPFEEGDGDGENAQQRQGDDELQSLRPYVIGDALSRIAWKQSSRGALLLKQFSGNSLPRLLLTWDKTEGDRESRLSQLALWIEQAEAEALPYALKLPHFETDFGRGKEQRRRCLQALAAYED